MSPETSCALSSAYARTNPFTGSTAIYEGSTNGKLFGFAANGASAGGNGNGNCDSCCLTKSNDTIEAFCGDRKNALWVDSSMASAEPNVPVDVVVASVDWSVCVAPVPRLIVS